VRIFTYNHTQEYRMHVKLREF